MAENPDLYIPSHAPFSQTENTHTHTHTQTPTSISFLTFSPTLSFTMNKFAMADLDKENICPSSLPPSLPLKFDSKSPLPLGFPRAPLQDITHVLSPLAPLNILPDEPGSSSDPSSRRKRTSDVALSSCVSISSRWSGLKSCTSVQTSIRVYEVVESAKPAEVSEISACVASTDDKSAPCELTLDDILADAEKSECSAVVETADTDDVKTRSTVKGETKINVSDVSAVKATSESHAPKESSSELRLAKKRRQVVSTKTISSNHTAVKARSDAKAKSSVLKFR